jgi:hypothetical protein
VAAHALRWTRRSLRSVPAITPMAGTLLIWSLLALQTDARSRGNELSSALSQLKHWNVRILGFDRDELLETSVIGARQCEQG